MRGSGWHALPWILLLALVTGRAAAQDGALLPEVRYFRTPVADPLATRLSAGLKHTNLLATQGAERPPFTLPPDKRSTEEVVAAVSLGVIFPLFEAVRWDGGGAVLVLDAKVFSRFRIQFPGRDDMGQDWFIGGGVEARQRRWSGRASFMHRSSHLGDEFMEATGAQRIEFGSEYIDVAAAYDMGGGTRLYGGGSWIFRSYLNWDPHLRELGISDRFLVQLGADGEWRPWQDRRFGIHAGIDWQAAERTDWAGAFSAAAGVGIRTTRSLRLMARFYDGRSTMGEFFLTPERYLTLELMAEF
jgi:hypothetical protein